jgi:hypothetical protein
MKMQLILTLVMTAVVLVPNLSGATSLSSKITKSDESSNSPPQAPPMTKRQVVKQYVGSCSKKPTKGVKKEVNCDKLRKDAVEIVKDSLHTLGSSTKRTYLPTILKFFKSDEVVLRIAAADAIGMIGPQDNDAELLAPLANDPVPDVRMAVGQAIGRGKSPALNLLGQRVMALYPGATPDSSPDPGKLPVPVLPQSTYLYYASDPTVGRVSYVAKDLNATTAFYKSKAKKGPFKFDEFQEKYRFQLGDEDRAKNNATETESAKQNENLKPDASNMQAMMGKMQKMGKQTSIALNDLYQAPMFEKPTVYILEERQIGSRTYPTRYVVLYQDVALNRPGYRLSWLTLSDDKIKRAQAETLKDEQQETAGKKRQEALEDLVKKKDEQEKKNFKKGQADLEKELGF